MGRVALIFLAFLILQLSSANAIPTSPRISINAGCTQTSIEKYCKPEHLFCIRSACSQCILRDPFNPFVSFCGRLIDCVCSISTDEQCAEKVEQSCY